ncbi:MAG: hypothetical protein Q7V14_06475 [Coriobacteriia bacterium]|nr:hypothetical protein [Coriobacteriia bacterium]MDO9107577.1 hypothetical protein [Coriobacteriia bacterium]
MSMHGPDVTDEDLGMRAFQLRKAKAVERAAERMRHSLADQWAAMSNHEVEELEWALGELWAYIARDEWDGLRFGKLDSHDVRMILGYGRELRKHSRNAVEVLGDIGKVVTAKG